MRQWGFLIVALCHMPLVFCLIEEKLDHIFTPSVVAQKVFSPVVLFGLSNGCEVKIWARRALMVIVLHVVIQHILVVKPAIA